MNGHKWQNKIGERVTALTRLPVLRASRSLENGNVFQFTKGVLNVDFIFLIFHGLRPNKT